MNGKVYFLPPGLQTRPPYLHDHLPVEYPEYALGERRHRAHVMRSYASITLEEAPSSRQKQRKYTCGRSSRLDICDRRYHADRRA
jgi:hypothetical protein